MRSPYFMLRWRGRTRVDWDAPPKYDALIGLYVPVATEYGPWGYLSLARITDDKRAKDLHPEVVRFVALAEAQRVVEGL